MPAWISRVRPRSLVELGAGSAVKTRIILNAMLAAGTGENYVPVDISADFLERTASALRRDYPELNVVPVVADFTRPLSLPPDLSHPALLTFLGSTIGNFAPAAAIDLLRRVRAALQPQDRFLLGVDLRKDVAILEAAYNDSRGVTAAFNLNLLRVINARFGADFDLEAFRHRAVYNAREHRIEMHLISTRPHTVRIPGVGEIEFAADETIRTEISSKYDRPMLLEMFDAAGMTIVEWQEAAGGLFALTLGAATGGQASAQRATRAGAQRCSAGAAEPGAASW